MAERERATSLGEKVRWLAFGSVLTFGLFEGGLRLAGLVLTPSLEAEEARYTILCEGDSFTYGIGGNAFPDQLEDILNARAGERLFRTINTAVPGINTTLLADDMVAHIREHRPDLVIVTTGENNSWNAIRLSKPDAGAWATLESYLLYSRVYKFIKVAQVGWSRANFHEGASELMDIERAANHLTDYEEVIGLPQQREEEQPEGGRPTAYDEGQVERYREAWEASDQGRYDDANALFEGLIAEVPQEIHGYLGLAGSLMRLNRLDDAARVLQDALAVDTTEAAPAETYFALGWAQRRSGDHEAAVKTWTNGLRVYPMSGKLFQTIANTRYQLDRDIWLALDVAKEVPEVANNPLHKYLVRLSEMSQGYATEGVRELVSESFRADMVKIAEAGELLDVPMIFSGYPTHAYTEVEDVALAYDLPYVDFRPIFAARYTSKEQFLGADGCHCNSEGYRLMAEVLADEVEDALGLSLPHSPSQRIDQHPEVTGPGFSPGPRDMPQERPPADGVGPGPAPSGAEAPPPPPPPPPVGEGRPAGPDGVPTGLPARDPVTGELL